MWAFSALSSPSMVVKCYPPTPINLSRTFTEALDRVTSRPGTPQMAGHRVFLLILQCRIVLQDDRLFVAPAAGSSCLGRSHTHEDLWLMARLARVSCPLILALACFAPVLFR